MALYEIRTERTYDEMSAMVSGVGSLAQIQETEIHLDNGVIDCIYTSEDGYAVGDSGQVYCVLSTGYPEGSEVEEMPPTWQLVLEDTLPDNARRRIFLVKVPDIWYYNFDL